MNIRTDFPVCLRIQAEDTTEPFRDELLLVLLDHEVHSIHEVDGSGLC